MTEDYTIQLSTKFGERDESMLNIRAQTQREFNELLDYLKENSGTITFVADTVRATAVEGKPVAANPPSQPYANHQPAQVSQPQQNQQQPVCAHGPMTHRTGTSKKTGKPWEAHFCPAPQGQPQCEPVFH